MFQKKLSIIFYGFFLINCVTIPIGVRREPSTNEVIERKPEMQVIKIPSIIPAEGEELAEGMEITAHTKIEPDFVIKIQENLKQRHNYNDIITHKKYLHPVVKYTLLIAGNALGCLGVGLGWYLLAGQTGYIALGRDLIGGGIITSALITIPTLILSKTKEFKKIEKKFNDDQDFFSVPLKDKLINGVINGSIYSLSLRSDSFGEIRIPADSIIKLCPEKDEVEITVKLTDEPSLSKQLIITSTFINSCKKIEELKKLEQIQLVKLEKERKKIEAEIVKIINKVWKNKDEVSSATSISYSADGTVNIMFVQSKSERTACIKAGKMWGVSRAIRLFETSAWNQFIVIAPALFKRSDVSTVKLTMDVAFSAIINPSHEYAVSAVEIVMSRATAKNIKWGSDIMRKDPEDVADSFSTDEMFRIFLLDGFERGAFYDTWE